MPILWDGCYAEALKLMHTIDTTCQDYWMIATLGRSSSVEQCRRDGDSYYSQVFAVELGEPGVVGYGRHDHGQVPEREQHELSHEGTEGKAPASTAGNSVQNYTRWCLTSFQFPFVIFPGCALPCPSAAQKIFQGTLGSCTG